MVRGFDPETDPVPLHADHSHTNLTCDLDLLATLPCMRNFVLGCNFFNRFSGEVNKKTGFMRSVSANAAATCTQSLSDESFSVGPVVQKIYEVVSWTGQFPVLQPQDPSAAGWANCHPAEFGTQLACRREPPSVGIACTSTSSRLLSAERRCLRRGSGQRPGATWSAWIQTTGGGRRGTRCCQDSRSCVSAFRRSAHRRHSFSSPLSR